MKFYFNYLSVRINSIALLCGENASDSDTLTPVDKLPVTQASCLQPRLRANILTLHKLPINSSYSTLKS